jgi:hypothetical protein
MPSVGPLAKNGGRRNRFGRDGRGGKKRGRWMMRRRRKNSYGVVGKTAAVATSSDGHDVLKIVVCPASHNGFEPGPFIA